MTGAWLEDEGERTMVFLVMGPRHQNRPLGNASFPVLGPWGAQQLG